jgi:hypothetical protein
VTTLAAMPTPARRGAIRAHPLSLIARDSRYPNAEITSDLTMLRTFFHRLAARLRGDPPPVSELDVRRARHVLDSATAEDQIRGRDAARRALDAAKGPAVPARGTDPDQP